MKTKLTLLIISILFLSACSTTYYSSIPYDDVYYSGQDQFADNSEYNEVEVYEGEYDSEYAEEAQEEYQEEYFDHFNDDFNAYYNYLYSARLRRFHNPHYSYGYYNNYFTNMYWYDMNPYMWGSSIYLNSGWMMPYQFGGWGGSFYAGFGFGGYGMGWPYYNYGWPYYDSGWPYSMFNNYYGYNSYYGFGYLHGYYNSYYGNNYYYNSRDSYSQYYRHRTNRGRNYNRPNSQSNTFGEMYETKYYASREDRNSVSNQRSNSRDAKSFTNKSLSTGTPSTGRNRSNTTISEGAAGGSYRGETPYSRLNNASDKTSIQRSVANQNAKSYTKPQETRKSSTLNSSRLNLQNTKSVKTYQKPTLKYSKPNTTKSTNNRNTNSRQYSTQQEYGNSGSRTITRPTLNRTSTNNSLKSIKRVITAPSRSSKSYTSPSRSNGNPISISRSSSNRSFSSPIRSSSSRSFSSPTKSSSRSVSTPSRSSSSGTSTGSSSGSRGTKSSSGSSGRGKKG